MLRIVGHFACTVNLSIVIFLLIVVLRKLLKSRFLLCKSRPSYNMNEIFLYNKCIINHYYHVTNMSRPHETYDDETCEETLFLSEMFNCCAKAVVLIEVTNS